MQGSGVTQPVKFLANETPLLVIAKWEKLLTLALRLKKVMNFLVFSSFYQQYFTFSSFCCWKNKLMPVFYHLFSYWWWNDIITLLKFVVDPLARGNSLTMLWRHFIIRTDNREFKMPLRRRQRERQKQLVKISKTATMHVHHAFL